MKIGRTVLVFGTMLSLGCIVDAGRAAYEGCNGGQSCGGGTVCTTVGYSNTGDSAYLCTVGCSVASSCPAVGVNSAYLPTCVVNATTGVGDCYDTCGSNIDCGLDTTCAAIPGTIARICVPNAY